jgi:CheY-like chemotaxis protein
MTDRRTFLVLDDDEDGRFLARYALEKAFPGARVLEAAEPANALRLVVATPLDGIVADHHPGLLDGPALIQQFRAAGISCPVVVITASCDPSVPVRAYAAGAARVLAGCEFDLARCFQDALRRN